MNVEFHPFPKMARLSREIICCAAAVGCPPRMQLLAVLILENVMSEEKAEYHPDTLGSARVDCCRAA